MTVEKESLPANVLQALHQGNTLEAVKLLCESTGLGLKESKDAIYEHLQERPSTVAGGAAFKQLPASVVAALQRGEKVEAIRLLREQTGLGLKEAKDAVEGESQDTYQANHHRPTVETPRSSGLIWWLLGLLLAGYAAYYLLQPHG